VGRLVAEHIRTVSCRAAGFHSRTAAEAAVPIREPDR
jgi:hypothetical protein